MAIPAILYSLMMNIVLLIYVGGCAEKTGLAGTQEQQYHTCQKKGKVQRLGPEILFV